MPLFEYKSVDRGYYEREISSFLPKRVIDAHTHVYKREFSRPDAQEQSLPGRSQHWPSLVADENPIEDLVETYKILLPETEVTPVMFAYPDQSYDTARSNAYVAECAMSTGFPSLYVSTPEETAEGLEHGIVSGGFKGAKVYLNFAPSYIPGDEIRIFDFLPHHQLEMLDQHCFAVMLHIPRPNRLRDHVNIEQMLEIDRKYPNVKIIVAHVGRAYATADLGDALDRIADSRLLVDVSANTNRLVFEEAIKKIGPTRILYGSDLPIERMRMKRIVENDTYINIVERGKYGDLSGEPHMRETDGVEAGSLTFFFYEEISAIRRAAESAGLTGDQINRIFYANSAELFGIAANGETL